jgi:Autotransporter beta-domain
VKHPQPFRSLIRTSTAAIVLSAPWFAPVAMAQATPSSTVQDDEDEAQRDARRKDRERAERGSEQAAPQAVGDAPVPPQGGPTPKPIVTRGPLQIHRSEVSLGIDRAFAPRWVASGLLGLARGRLQRSQSELPPDALPGSPPQTSDTTLRTRSTTLTTMLTYLPATDLFFDATLSAMRTSLDVHRVVNELALFEGDTVGRAFSLGFNAGGTWRVGGGTLVPQVGLEVVRSHVDRLSTTLTFSDGTRDEGFTVDVQRSHAVSLLAGAQMQWPRSAGFGVWAPYARTALRQRLSIGGDTIVATAPGANPILTDPSAITPRRAGTLAGGVLFLWPRGVGAFVDLGLTRGSGDLRERNIAAGLKFEI